MTREEEIKARLEKAQVNASSYPVTMMDADLAYLLSRNEELQRRVEKMEAVVDIERKIISINDDSISVLKGNKKVSNKESFLDACSHELVVLEIKLRKEIKALDAADGEEK